ncbi:MAG: LamG domain-containing protein [Bacteroidetes bacterium]|jgi:hypothetical protein|nr:LamG domain-containing protein [Bacteroidota bacterium]MBT4399907.1 LamG domain-containing protein [Bacteroidota bacterium]MBT7091948.1 LamG domain-containing protein [Bacteroidota bacterium]MBT7463461.1 LamG domain-containing protein [Bacteroidota bacterium]
MKKISIILFLFPFGLVMAQMDNDPLAHWSFDEESPGYEVIGKGLLVPGVKGKAYKFDGFSSYIEDKSLVDSKMPRSFSIEAWVSLGAYPWNWAPIVTIGKFKVTGFYFGVDSRGRVGFQMSDATSVWHSCKSELIPGTKLGMELGKWYHVACTYSPQKGMAVYINGELSGNYNDFEFKYGVRYSKLEEGFRIGMNREELAPTDPIRDWATWPSQYSFDGIIDEVKIHSKALSDNEISSLYDGVVPEYSPQFASRDFPKIPSSGRFGANYTRLEFYPEWDNIWPVGDHLDVAVQFDDLPVKVMFWRGTRYSACWVSENNKWMADQSRETGYNWFLNDGSRDDMPTGCMEHMSDVQTRSSRVAIIENNDARVVVNWRYLQMDVKFRQKDLPDNTLFGEWGNELYYIYPDGVAIRKVLPGRGGWQETILLNAPGTTPEDNIELEACTLINMNGESKSYTWEHGYPKFDLEAANIQLINFKSEYKPFLIFREGGSYSVFNGEVRPEYSHFPWWNHWPVAQIASDGRSAFAPDRAAHSSLSWGNTQGPAAMYGMTNKLKDYLVDLAKSWNRPPELNIHSKGFMSNGYDYTQRAYLIESDSKSTDLSFDLIANDNSPILNPAFVIVNWPGKEANLQINGKKIPEGTNFRQGLEYGIDGSKTLILWMKRTANKTINITLSNRVTE